MRPKWVGSGRPRPSEQSNRPWTRLITGPAPCELLLSTVTVVPEAGSWTERIETPAS